MKTFQKISVFNTKMITPETILNISICGYYTFSDIDLYPINEHMVKEITEKINDLFKKAGYECIKRSPTEEGEYFDFINKLENDKLIVFYFYSTDKDDEDDIPMFETVDDAMYELSLVFTPLNEIKIPGKYNA